VVILEREKFLTEPIAGACQKDEGWRIVCWLGEGFGREGSELVGGVYG